MFLKHLSYILNDLFLLFFKINAHFLWLFGLFCCVFLFCFVGMNVYV